MKAVVEQVYPAQERCRYIIIKYTHRLHVIYGLSITGYWLCIPAENIACKLGDLAKSDEEGYNKYNLALSFKAAGWPQHQADEYAEAILNAIYDFENGKKQCS